MGPTRCTSSHLYPTSTQTAVHASSSLSAGFIVHAPRILDESSRYAGYELQIPERTMLTHQYELQYL